MDIKTLFPNLSAMWVRWSDYEIKKFSGVPYIVPTANSVEFPYSYAEQTSELVADALNLGKQLFHDDFLGEYYDRAYEPDPESQQKNAESEKACLNFARKYGLLGLVTPDRSDVLFARAGSSPMHQDPSGKSYGEEFTCFAATFVTLYLHLLCARGDLPQKLTDYHETYLSEMTEKPIPGGMSYRLTAGSPPQLVWQPDSLEAILHLAYGLAVTDTAQPLKVCKNCGKVYHNPHQKSEFCSVKCRNYYNVQVFRGKGKEGESP